MTVLDCFRVTDRSPQPEYHRMETRHRLAAAHVRRRLAV
jgi:hypothetical protein